MDKEFLSIIDNDLKKSDKFETFKNLLVEYNKMFNLTAITEEEEIYIKHFYDSLAAKDLLFDGAKIIEIGSGGGFPSIPLKINNESLNFTLCESVLKKCNFLNVVKEKLNFENFEIINDRCEIIAKNPLYRQNYDFCVARAVAKLNTLCEYMLPFLKIGGFMIAFKGENSQDLNECDNALKILGGKIEKVINYELLNNMGKRSLIIIKKVAPTPEKYPRGNNKERSKPL